MKRVIYRQMGKVAGSEGRVIKEHGQLVAQVKHEDNWRRASTKQAVALFRNALRFSLLQPGDPVVAWAGSRLVKGTFAGTIGGQLKVNVSGDDSIISAHVLPLDVAREIGLWEFREGMQVAAYYGDRWVRGIWLAFEDGRHSVALLLESDLSRGAGHSAPAETEWPAVGDSAPPLLDPTVYGHELEHSGTRLGFGPSVDLLLAGQGIDGHEVGHSATLAQLLDADGIDRHEVGHSPALLLDAEGVDRHEAGHAPALLLDAEGVDRHEVGHTVSCDRAHPAYRAIEMGLIDG